MKEGKQSFSLDPFLDKDFFRIGSCRSLPTGGHTSGVFKSEACRDDIKLKGGEPDETSRSYNYM
ncbi:hypothetical protein, partial [Aminicella lysinilytica]|uniref:hypothetical protein n=1 Tax=Aminicella lysinilytica TaxID=433323 RepID=UPI0026F3657D